MTSGDIIAEARGEYEEIAEDIIRALKVAIPDLTDCTGLTDDKESEMNNITTHKIRKEIARLESILDRTTSNYDKAKATLDRIHELEAELNRRRSR